MARWRSATPCACENDARQQEGECERYAREGELLMTQIAVACWRVMRAVGGEKSWRGMKSEMCRFASGAFVQEGLLMQHSRRKSHERDSALTARCATRR